MSLEKIRLGISACLLGQKVRYDGGHKHDRFLTDTLGAYVSFVPVCPEVEAGFGVPREPMRLVGRKDEPSLLTSRTGRDHTQRMVAWARNRVQELEKEDLCGFIFKSGSPSSGMERVKVYSEQGIPAKTGVGLFAREFMNHFPRIPVEDDGRLHDPRLRENFVERIFVFSRWRECLALGHRRGYLVDFHTVHKMLIMAHSVKHLQSMGKLVARAKEMSPRDLFEQFETLLMDALRLRTTNKKNANVLQHIMGYFKKELTAEEKAELLEIIDLYRREYVPLIVPITLLNHYVRKYRQVYLEKQYYLNPHPIELKLRNHV